MKTITCDIDGILTKEIIGHSKKEYQQRTPNLYNIETLRDYHVRGFKIKLYSARFKEDYDITLEYLQQYKVPFDELILGKPQSEQYVDDMTTNQLDREVLCLSGGVDSIIAAHFLDFPQCVQINLHHKYYVKEYQCINRLKDIIPKLNVCRVEGPDLHNFEIGDKAYIPFRNLHLATMASHYGNKIYICGVKGDKVEDKSLEAFSVLSHAFNFIKKPEEQVIKIESPFWKMTKTDIIKWFLDNYPEKYVKEVLRTSVSCYDEWTGEGNAGDHWGQCGECPACFRKWIALESAGIKSYDWFKKDIRKWKEIKTYKQKIENGEYDYQRAKETQEVLEKYHLW